jgi:hypothetical protein
MLIKKLHKPEIPSLQEVWDMVIHIHWREKHISDPNTGEPSDAWVESQALVIERELRDHDIDFQEVSLKNERHGHHVLQIFCNDPEEREHIKHLLLWNQAIWCFEMEGRRYFTRHVKEDERNTFTWTRGSTKRPKSRRATTVTRNTIELSKRLKDCGRRKMRRWPSKMISELCENT